MQVAGRTLLLRLVDSDFVSPTHKPQMRHQGAGPHPPSPPPFDVAAMVLSYCTIILIQQACCN
jgi:hypothetical protein